MTKKLIYDELSLIYKYIHLVLGEYPAGLLTPVKLGS